ncbi:MAG: hypothetical protein UR52_C0028G0006 [Candidatus Gottesmanbacteria bacterium GW2011_GWA1_34_13]|uniref:50S ribosomal protein L28 n=1 Tax=Candidatus Gottesmanbacteria bacterium GW2011_GWA1_34_13 TaxID=1618434 RepID=A0A0G0D2Z8_9BACT|nr:MAG: hypothetical protein UR52_C0028G0006 [Candidatus Gottesmanbacteria bacterium GW2011_GWA1_34_13]
MSMRGQHHKGVAGGTWKHKAQKSVKLNKVNLHKIKAMYEGQVEQVKLCTDCISKLRKDGKLKSGIIKINYITVKAAA